MKNLRPLTAEEYRLVQDNIGLAMFLYRLHLKKMQKRANYGIDPDDLLSQAFYGLIRAAMRYRPYGEEKGYSEESIATGQYFSVFAKKSIVGQMLDHLRRMDHVHTLVRSDYKALQEKGFGNDDESLDDIAQKAGLTAERAERVVNLIQARPVSLDDIVSGETEQTVGEQLQHDTDVETTALESALRYAFVQKYDELPELLQFVIAGKYYANLGLTELAEMSEQSIIVIREAHTEALLQIHQAFLEALS